MNPAQSNPTYQTKPTKLNLPNQTYQTQPTKPNLPAETYQNLSDQNTKPDIVQAGRTDVKIKFHWINRKTLVQIFLHTQNGQFCSWNLLQSNQCYQKLTSWLSSSGNTILCIYHDKKKFIKTFQPSTYLDVVESSSVIENLKVENEKLRTEIIEKKESIKDEASILQKRLEKAEKDLLDNCEEEKNQMSKLTEEIKVMNSIKKKTTKAFQF